MSKANGGNDLLMLGALAVGAMFFMSRSRVAGTTASPLRALFGGTGLARNVGGTSGNAGFLAGAAGGLVGSITRTGSPDVVASGGYTGGGMNGVFSDISSYDNATQAVRSNISGDIAAGAGIPVNYNWSQWLGSVGGAQSQFYLPDQTNPMQNPYAGFDNPDNYG